MEAGGSANAAFQSAHQPGFFMIRGVSDLADPDKDSDSVGRWLAGTPAPSQPSTPSRYSKEGQFRSSRSFPKRPPVPFGRDNQRLSSILVRPLPIFPRPSRPVVPRLPSGSYLLDGRTGHPARPPLEAELPQRRTRRQAAAATQNQSAGSAQGPSVHQLQPPR